MSRIPKLPLMLVTLVLAACGSSSVAAGPVTPASPTPQVSAAAQPSPATGTPQPSVTCTQPAASPLQWSQAPAMQIDSSKSYSAVIHTSAGDITIGLWASKAPRTVNNFVFLAEHCFYNGVIFHRVIQTFMVQTGDPTGTGSGGPGYQFADELPPPQPYAPGIVAMANSGPDTNGSQFFICTGPDAANLNSVPNYTEFGSVTGGTAVVQAIAASPVGPGNPGENSRPLNPPQITSVTIATS